MSLKIRKLAELCSRSVVQFQADSWQEDAFQYVDVSAIDNAAKAIGGAKRTLVSDAPSRAQQVVKSGDVLVSTVRPSLNAVARITGDFDGAVCSSAFTVLRCGPELLPDFLYCFVQSPGFIDRLVSLAQGSHYPAVTDRHVLASEIALPEKDAQAELAGRILEALHTARSACRLIGEQVQLGSELSARILAVGFGGEVPLRLSAESMPAHAGWSWQSLLRLAQLRSGHTPSRRHPEWWGGHVPWLALPDIRKLHGKLAYETTEDINDAGLKNSSARLLPVGTVCLCRDASIGFVTILGRPMATSQHFCNWVCDPERLDPEFLMYAFMASHDYLRELGSGSVLKTIYMPTIESFHICAPAIDEQRRIAGMLRERLAAVEVLNARLRERLDDIERLPQRLLAAAFEQVA